MKKTLKWIFIVLAFIALFFFIYYFISSKPKNQQTLGTKTSTNIQNRTENTNLNVVENTLNMQVENKVISATENEAPIEEELSEFSTDILIDDDNRDNNLKLTASKINSTIVKKGESFSFNDTVGNPTPDKGYEKAGIFVNGKKEKGYGGGNCQVSTTLYDAVLKVDGLEVTERHEHGKEVGYVEMGKDATVVYDELDLKFKNNTENDIKIYSEVTEEEVKVRIVKLSS